MSKKRKVNKDTQVYRDKVMRSLRNKLLKLWCVKVKERAGFKCEVDNCSTGLALNAHHVENFMVNKELRYDIKNGVCLCQSHHKFLAKSAHKSFVFMYNLMLSKHPDNLQYLLNFKAAGEELTIELLEQKIKEMEATTFSVKEEVKSQPA